MSNRVSEGNSVTAPEDSTRKPRTSYVMASEWDREELRLKALEEYYDPGTISVLTALGVKPGWRCLEVGAGAGSIARWLSTMVGSTGAVIATDIDIRFLTAQQAHGVQVRQHDITSDDLEEGGFDLIHARAVLEHLPERQRVVDHLVSLLAPGGRLLLEDHDVGPTAVAAFIQYANSAEVATRTSRFLAACAQLMVSAGADPCYGAKLPAALESAGLSEVAVEVRVNTIAGRPDNVFSLSLQRLRDPFMATGILNQAECDALLTDFADPTLRIPGAPMVAAHGRKPPG